jgi:NTE family protein
MYKKFDLIFEGGGAKGSTFVGAMRAFESRGHTFRRLVGTSAGAITATLLAVGFTPDKMLQAVNERLNGKPRFASFMDISTVDGFSQMDKDESLILHLFKAADVPFVPDRLENGFDKLFLDSLMRLPHFRQLFCFVECGGLYSGEKFLEWIREKLDEAANVKGKPSFANASFSEFFSLTGVDLSLVASDTDGQEMLVLNHRTAPNCPVACAVRMSMSIPFVWREVVWKSEWGPYLNRDITGHRIVDGGVLSNFPLALVDKEPTEDSFVKQVMGNTRAAEAGTIGLLIDESLEVPEQPAQGHSKLIGEFRTVNRVLRLVDTMTKTRDNHEIQLHPELVCRLPAKGYGTTEFDIPEPRLKALIDTGEAAMNRYLDGLKKED